MRDGTQAGGGGVAGEAGLHGRGLAGEDEQTVARRVLRQIDQHVHGIRANQVCEPLVGNVPDIAPFGCQRSKTIRHRIGLRGCEIAQHIELLPIMLREQRQHIAPDDVVSKIR